MDQDDLVLLKLRLEDSQTILHWEHAHEFEYQGQMYDLVETAIKGDTVYYRCWLDSDESKIKVQIKELVANALNTNPEHQGNTERLVHFYKSLYWFEHPELAEVSLPSGSDSIVPTALFFRSGVLAPPVSPPPELG